MIRLICDPFGDPFGNSQNSLEIPPPGNLLCVPSSSQTDWQSTTAAAADGSVNLNSTVLEARVVPTCACVPLDVISMGTRLALVVSSARKTQILYTEHVEIGFRFWRRIWGH